MGLLVLHHSKDVYFPEKVPVPETCTGNKTLKHTGAKGLPEILLLPSGRITQGRG